MPRSFCRTPCINCFCPSSVKFRISVSIFDKIQSQAHSALGSMLAAPPSCPEPDTRAWSLPGVGGALDRPRRRLLRRRDLPWRPTEGTPRQNAVRRRPKPPGSPRGLMHASTRPWHHHCGPASTERAPCRRRAAPPPFRRARPKHPNPGQFST